jgi:hypothetical protein
MTELADSVQRKGRATDRERKGRAEKAERGRESYELTTRNGKIKVRPSTSELHCYVTIGSLYVEKL